MLPDGELQKSFPATTAEDRPLARGKTKHRLVLKAVADVKDVRANAAKSTKSAKGGKKKSKAAVDEAFDPAFK